MYSDDLVGDIIDGEVDIVGLEERGSQRRFQKQSGSFYKTLDCNRRYSEKNKIKSKNKYVQKLKELVDDSDKEKISKKEFTADLDKKERNRVAAKHSRDRKKLYAELMESEQRKLQEELSKVNSELAEAQAKINSIQAENKIIGAYLTLGDSENQLAQIVKSQRGETTNKKINWIIDSMRLRMGATGKERVNKLNQCFKQIINLSLPLVHRYFLWTASEGKHIFNSSQNKQANDNFRKQMVPIIPDLPKAVEQLRNLQSNFIEGKENLAKLITSLRRCKDSLGCKSEELDDEMDDLRNILNPLQCANLILSVHRKKYQQEFNFLNENDPNNDKQQYQKDLQKDFHELGSLPSKRYKYDSETRPMRKYKSLNDETPHSG